MSIEYKYIFELPEELKGLNPLLDEQEYFVVYSGSEKEARKNLKKSAKRAYSVKVKSDPKLIRREHW